MRRTLLVSLTFILAVSAAVLGHSSSPAASSDAASFASSPLLSATLTPSAGTSASACQARLRPGAAGIATRSFKVPTVGQVDLRMTGRKGDLDLAVFDAQGKPLAASAEPAADEVASGWAPSAGTLTLQVCRRSGPAGTSAPVAVRFTPLPVVSHAFLMANKPQLVQVQTPTRADKDEVEKLGLDLAEDAGRQSIGVVLHGTDDKLALAKAGLKYKVLDDDLVAHDAADRRTEASAARVSARAALPGGRTTYRTLADYETELKTLAKDNPGLVKLITLKEKTYLGRSVMGIEITQNVDAKDGKPDFFNMGIHHAREWPAGELVMEYALDLIKGYKAGDARIKNIVENERTTIVPVVNPDGFNASRSAAAMSGGDGGRDEAVNDDAYIVAGTASGGEYRRKNCRVMDDSTDGNCLTSAGLRETGVDPNRNYGALWGGPGASTTFADQDYRGPGPFSEPESRNIRDYVAHHQVETLITNHTTAGLVLRAPGLAQLGSPIDENRGYKALGDAMAKQNGYFSQKSYELYDTTGTTEDWTYNVTGGFGFTFEAYCGAPNYTTGDCDQPSFHPTYARVADEYFGDSKQANHVDDPGPDKGFDGKGDREAYLIAAESTLDPARHSILKGSLPPGDTLRLTKSFKTDTYPQADGKPITFDDHLEYVMDVDATGKVEWHVNPSTRPIVAKDSGDKVTGTPSPAITQQGSTTGSPSDPNDDGQAIPNPGGGNVPYQSINYNDHPFTVPAEGVNRGASVRAEWTDASTDWDMELWEDVNGNGKIDDGDKQVGTSGQGTTNFEETSIAPDATNAGHKYVVRMDNFAAAEPYTLTVKFNAPLPFKPGTVESYTMTCEREGTVFDTQQVTVDRGQVKNLDLDKCAKATAGSFTPAVVSPAGKVTTPACVAGVGFKSVTATPSASGAKLGFVRRNKGTVTTSVYQQSHGRSIFGARLVARFAKRTAPVTWSGKPTVKGRKLSDGYYLVKYEYVSPSGAKDNRRLVLERINGRFHKRPNYHRPETCTQLRIFRIERAVFGGPKNRPMVISYRTAARVKATITVSRGSKVVARLTQTKAGSQTHFVRVASRKLTRANYKVRITVGSGTTATTASLFARRL